MTDTATDLRERVAAAVRDVRLRLGPNAIRLAQDGHPLPLSLGEAELLIDAVMAALQEEAAQRWLRGQEEQLGIKWADFRAGRWEMDLAAGRDFAAAYVAAARALLGDAPNYTETRLEFDVKIAESPEVYTLVVQRHAPGVLTPHEARQHAEARVAELEAELAQLRAERGAA